MRIATVGKPECIEGEAVQGAVGYDDEPVNRRRQIVQGWNQECLPQLPRQLFRIASALNQSFKPEN